MNPCVGLLGSGTNGHTAFLSARWARKNSIRPARGRDRGGRNQPVQDLGEEVAGTRSEPSGLHAKLFVHGAGWDVLRLNEIVLRDEGAPEIQKRGLRCRYALRFGDEKSADLESQRS